MDPSLFCEVTIDGEDESNGPSGTTTEEDIVIDDNDQTETPKSKKKVNKSKRKLVESQSKGTPPTKKAKKTNQSPAIPNKSMSTPKILQGTKFKSVGGLVGMSPKQANFSPKQKQGISGGGPKPSQTTPGKLKQSITWKYRQLPENQYTADIRKSEILKHYEPEKCVCKRVGSGDSSEESACGSGCINRSLYLECDPELCINGKSCTNIPIQVGRI